MHFMHFFSKEESWSKILTLWVNSVQFQIKTEKCTDHVSWLWEKSKPATGWLDYLCLRLSFTTVNRIHPLLTKNIHLFTWKAELQMMERQRSLNLLIHSTDDFKGQGLPRLKPGAPSKSPTCCRWPKTQIICCYFPRHITKELNSKFSSPESKQH